MIVLALLLGMPLAGAVLLTMLVIALDKHLDDMHLSVVDNFIFSIKMYSILQFIAICLYLLLIKL